MLGELIELSLILRCRIRRRSPRCGSAFSFCERNMDATGSDCSYRDAQLAADVLGEGAESVFPVEQDSVRQMQKMNCRTYPEPEWRFMLDRRCCKTRETDAGNAVSRVGVEISQAHTATDKLINQAKRLITSSFRQAAPLIRLFTRSSAAQRFNLPDR